MSYVRRTDTTHAPLRVISYGGGVQSTAMIVMASDGRLPPVDAALFANVGDDSEHPSTIAYVRDVMIPWARERGVDVHELTRRKRDGTTETLLGRIAREGSKSLPIPVRMSDTGAPGTRSCTHDFKIAVIAKWLRAHGASCKNKAEVCIGFSWDEAIRIGNMKLKPYESIVYPLIDLRMTREDCKRVIERAGLPVPPKSSCYFCPFHRPSVWATMRRDEPELFQKSCDLETLLNRRRDTLGKDRVYLTRFGKPLADVIIEAQPQLDLGSGPGETCDEGYCWT
jgi:hypothetical protein